MLATLREAVLPYIVGAMVHKCERLTAKERAAEQKYLAELAIAKRLTERPVIVACLGLVGSGKSTVARELARLIGGTIVEGDAIRVELRKRGETYDRARAIAEDAALEVVKQGGNAVLDSDFVDDKKRASIREKARQAGIRLVFIRTLCDIDVMVGRVLAATYKNSPDDFFGGASSPWKGSGQSRGAAVKVREMLRRAPQHYRWVNEIGGTWIPKKFSFAILATIDTADEKWKRNVEKCAKKLGIIA